MIKEIIKIIVDGLGGVGKTTMLKRLIEGTFDSSTPMTIGLDFFVKKYELFDKEVYAQFWDFVGISRFNVIKDICYKGANSMILVCDITRHMTFTEEIFNFYLQLAENAELKREQIILAASKVDLHVGRYLIREMLIDLCQKYNFHDFFEVSARSNDNIELLFESSVVLGMYFKNLISEEDFIDYNNDLKNRIKEPRILPQEKIIRKCFKCNRPLYYYEFYSANISKFPEDTLIKIWMSPYIQLYCCYCYKKLTNIQLSF
ncbi:MAG: Rab family GTPase [Promethearchaeota archaeon]